MNISSEEEQSPILKPQPSKDSNTHIQTNKNLLNLLEKMDKIREVLQGVQISLPSIAVIGD